MQAIMTKQNNVYLLLFGHTLFPSKRYQLDVVCCLTQYDYDFMLEHLNKMQTAIGEKLPYTYYFPKANLPELVITFQKGTIADAEQYKLIFNLGSMIVSQCDQLEYDELVKDLSMLQTREIGSKVYFPILVNNNDKENQESLL